MNTAEKTEGERQESLHTVQKGFGELEELCASRERERLNDKFVVKKLELTLISRCMSSLETRKENRI